MDQENDDGHMEHFDRFGRVTSSVASAILGHDTRSAKWAWRTIMGREREKPVTPDMQRGLDNEHRAVEELEIDLGVLTESGGFFAHPSLDWLGASPDAIIREGSLLIPVEAKCPRKLHTYVPLKYFHQIQVQLECLDAPYGYYVSWVEDSDAQFVVRVDRSDFWRDTFLPLLHDFHRDYVVRDIEPPTAKRGSKLNGDSSWQEAMAAVAAGKATTTACLESCSKTNESETTKTPVGKGKGKRTMVGGSGSAHGSTKTKTATSEST